MNDLTEQIRTVTALQQRLIHALREEVPEAQDWKLLLDVPRSGQVTICGETWAFSRHGTGISFRGPKGDVVDVHRCVTATDGVDPWRMLQFLESRGHSDRTQTESGVRDELEDLCKQGVLSHSDEDRLYRLCD